MMRLVHVRILIPSFFLPAPGVLRHAALRSRVVTAAEHIFPLFPRHDSSVKGAFSYSSNRGSLFFGDVDDAATLRGCSRASGMMAPGRKRGAEGTDALLSRCRQGSESFFVDSFCGSPQVVARLRPNLLFVPKVQIPLRRE